MACDSGRIGSLVADLECFLDNSLIFDDGGAIVGRRGGVKRWLQENIPALYLRYTTVMPYKAVRAKPFGVPLSQIFRDKGAFPLALTQVKC